MTELIIAGASSTGLCLRPNIKGIKFQLNQLSFLTVEFSILSLIPKVASLKRFRSCTLWQWHHCQVHTCRHLCEKIILFAVKIRIYEKSQILYIVQSLIRSLKTDCVLGLSGVPERISDNNKTSLWSLAIGNKKTSFGLVPKIQKQPSYQTWEQRRRLGGFVKREYWHDEQGGERCW